MPRASQINQKYNGSESEMLKLNSHDSMYIIFSSPIWHYPYINESCKRETEGVYSQFSSQLPVHGFLCLQSITLSCKEFEDKCLQLQGCLKEAKRCKREWVKISNAENQPMPLLNY